MVTTEAERPAPQQLFSIARRAIDAHLEGRRLSLPEGPQSQGVFVTLWAPGRELRGCVGRMQPLTRDLFTEVASCAVSAATRDPRFEALGRGELDGLEVEISLLEPEEPVSSAAELDPDRYGVVVRQGSRAGVLLPNVDGVRTAEEQVGIAMRKGSIDPSRPCELARFAVTKIREPEPELS